LSELAACSVRRQYQHSIEHLTFKQAESDFFERAFQDAKSSVGLAHY
jgi:hypothetical protein